MSATRKTQPVDVVIAGFFILFSLAFVVPLLVLINASLMNEEGVVEYGFTIVPRMFDTTSYEYIFRNPGQILSAYRVSILTSAIALLLYIFMATGSAYALANRKFVYRRFFAFFLFFTMLFSGGLAPQYIWMTRYLGLRDTMWALILPLLGNVWWIFVIRTFMQQIPDSLSEAATIDGANEYFIFFRIIVPLSKPAIATIGVMSLLFFWSSWFPALLYIDNKDLRPLQYLLQIMLRNVQQLTQDMDLMPVGYGVDDRVPREPVRMAMAIIAAGPMLIVFPFFQRYFVKGLTIGSVKG